MAKPYKFLGWMLFFVVGVITATASGQTATLRIVTYNIEADIDGVSTPRPGLIIPSGGGTTAQGGVLEGIGEEPLGANNNVQPLDIVALQETHSNSVTIAPIVSALNTYYNLPGMYAQSSVQATTSGGLVTGGNGPNGIVYNTTTLQLVATHGGVAPTGTNGNGISRQFMRYEFAPASVAPDASNEFYVYVSHYKSGTGTTNANARQGEATAIRADSATLPANSRVLYVGDYNISSSSESAYQTILAAGANAGIDVNNPSGTMGISWTGNSLLDQKTESSTSLHFRDDFMIMTNNIFSDTAGGLEMVPGTYHVFGNNGTTSFETNTNSGGNTALNNVVADGGAFISASQLRLDLTTAADHMPVVADFTIPVPEPSSLILLALGGAFLVLRRARIV